jgi:mono/diheme cytochrome c family protein
MPGFAAILSDGQIVEILDWLRQEVGKPGWPGLEQQVKAQR